MSNKFQNELETVGVAKTRVWELAAAAVESTPRCALDIQQPQTAGEALPRLSAIGGRVHLYFDETLLVIWAWSSSAPRAASHDPDRTD